MLVIRGQTTRAAAEAARSTALDVLQEPQHLVALALQPTPRRRSSGRRRRPVARTPSQRSAASPRPEGASRSAPASRAVAVSAQAISEPLGQIAAAFDWVKTETAGPSSSVETAGCWCQHGGTGRPIPPWLSDEPAWPTLRCHLLLLVMNGADPHERLRAACDAEELISAGDRAAVLDWRLRGHQHARSKVHCRGCPAFLTASTSIPSGGHIWLPDHGWLLGSPASPPQRRSRRAGLGGQAACPAGRVDG